MKLMATELSDAAKEEVKQTVAEVFPRVLPADWREIDLNAWNARCYLSTDGLKVLLEAEFQTDDRLGESLYLHLSVSRKDRCPSYFDLKRVKELFIGRERKGIQVFPPESEHYNHHPHCLHLFAPLGRDPLPDFRHESGAL